MPANAGTKQQEFEDPAVKRNPELARASLSGSATTGETAGGIQRKTLCGPAGARRRHLSQVETLVKVLSSWLLLNLVEDVTCLCVLRRGFAGVPAEIEDPAEEIMDSGRFEAKSHFFALSESGLELVTRMRVVFCTDERLRQIHRTPHGVVLQMKAARRLDGSPQIEDCGLGMAFGDSHAGQVRPCDEKSI